MNGRTASWGRRYRPIKDDHAVWHNQIQTWKGHILRPFLHFLPTLSTPQCNSFWRTATQLAFSWTWNFSYWYGVDGAYRVYNMENVQPQRNQYTVHTVSHTCSSEYLSVTQLHSTIPAIASLRLSEDRPWSHRSSFWVRSSVTNARGALLAYVVAVATNYPNRKSVVQKGTSKIHNFVPGCPLIEKDPSVPPLPCSHSISTILRCTASTDQVAVYLYCILDTYCMYMNPIQTIIYMQLKILRNLLITVPRASHSIAGFGR